MSPKPDITTCYEPKSGTLQYIVADPDTKQAVIIDTVLDFDPASNKISTEFADQLLALVANRGYTVDRLLETHVHADHLTASAYLQKKLGEVQKQRASICIGKRIKDVQSRFAARYGIDSSELSGAFDHTFDDHEKFSIGKLQAEVLHLPGHTPDHIGYMIGENVFTGESIQTSVLHGATSPADRQRHCSSPCRNSSHYRQITGCTRAIIIHLILAQPGKKGRKPRHSPLSESNGKKTST